MLSQIWSIFGGELSVLSVFNFKKYYDMSASCPSAVPASSRPAVHSLYVLKAFLAFFVVELHSPMLLPWVKIPGASVEIFFMITGYFLYHADLNKVYTNIKKSIKKVLIVLLILQVFYSFYMRGLGLIYLEDWSLIKTPVPWILWLTQGYSPIASGHLWFLVAMLYSLISFGVFLRLTRGRWIPVLFLLMIGWGLIGPFRPVFFGEAPSIFEFNFLGRALPTLAIGYYVRQNEATLLKLNWLSIYAVILALGGLEYLACDLYMGSGYAASWIHFIGLPTALFMCFLSYKDLGKGSILEHIGMRYAGNIYYFHKVVFLLWEYLNPKHPLLVEVYHKAGGLIVFMITLPIAWAIIKIQDRYSWNILR